MELQNVENLEATRKRLSVTDQAIIQACWSAVLQEHIGGDPTFGTIVSGRSIDFPEVDQVIGPLFNVIPFHVSFSEEDCWMNIVQRCHEANVSIMLYQHTPLRDIMKWRRSFGAELFDTLFVFQKEGQSAAEVSRNEIWQTVDDQGQADYPLALEVEQKLNGTLKFTMVAKGSIAHERDLDSLLLKIREALHSLLRNPETPISDTVHIWADQSVRDGINGAGDSHAVRNTATSNGLNGVHDANRRISPKPAHDLASNPQMANIRAAIASLAEVEEDDFDEDTSILELGLDSIDAIKLSSRLVNSGSRIPVSSIMRNPTLSKLAQLVAETDTNREAPSSVSFEAHIKRLRSRVESQIKSEDVEQILPATPLQEAMVAKMANSGFNTYFNHDVLRLKADVDVTRLKHAWEAVMRSSPILRTGFIEIDAPEIDLAYGQIVYADVDAFFRVRDIPSAKDIPNILDEIKHENERNGIEKPLSRITLSKTLEERYLILSLPHALYDGWSLSLLHEDVRKAYSGRLESRPPCNDLLRGITQGSGDDARNFWESFLGGASSTAFSLRTTQSDESKVHRKEKTSPLSSAELKSFCKSQRITVQSIGTTCWSYFLAAYTGKFDVSFGMVLAGRDTEQAQKILFPAMNTVAVRTLIHGSHRDMLEYMQGNLDEIRQHQHYPLRKSLGYSVSRDQTLFDSLFIYQLRPEGEESGQVLYESVGGYSDTEYLVCVELEMLADKLVWRIACKDAVFDSEGTERILEELDSVLASVVGSVESETIQAIEGSTTIGGLQLRKPENVSELRTDEDKTDVNGVSDDEWSSTEQALRVILSTVSKVPKEDISKQSTLFNVGLDSISAIKVSSLLRRQSIFLSVSEMLRCATVQKMAKLVDTRKQPSNKSANQVHHNLSNALSCIDTTEITRRLQLQEQDIKLVIPATAAQVYMMSVWQQSRGALFYPEFKYQASGNISSNLLIRAWERLVDRNPALRTVMAATGRSDYPFVQLITREIPDSICIVKNKREEANKHTMERTRASQPMASLTAFQADGSWDLNLMIHHALYDGISLPRLIHDFQDLCNEHKAIAPSYNPFVELAGQNVAQSAGDQRQRFWTQYLTGTISHQLPRSTRRSTSRVEYFKPGFMANVHELNRVTKTEGVSIQSLFLAAYTRIYAKLSCNDPSEDAAKVANDVVFGIYLANRSHAIEGLDEVAAPTVNLVPLRVKLTATSDLVESAKQIQQDLQEIGSLVNSAVGLWEIEQWTGLRIDSFVNFLSLPDVDGEAKDRDESEITIREASKNRMSEECCNIVEPDVEKWVEPEALKRNVVKDAYRETLDIEVAIRNGGLDIGVFCPISMLNVDMVKQLVDDMRDELGTFS